MASTGEGISVQLLGPLRAWRDGEEVVLGPPKQRAVFALLADRAQDVVATEHIIDAVWGSEIPHTATGGVHTYVAGLRRALNPAHTRRTSTTVLASASGGYCLHVPPEAVDLHHHTRLHAQARKAAAESHIAEAVRTYRQCLALWHGDPLGTTPGPRANLERTRLQDLRLTVTEEWAAVMLRAGRPGEVIADLSAATADAPLREKLCWLLMLALHRCDRQAQALAVHADIRRLLHTELGIPPGHELRTLHQDILAGREITALRDELRPSAGPHRSVLPHTPRPAQLPPLARGFIGREAHLNSLYSLLVPPPTTPSPPTSPAPTIAAIDGLPTVGKTALALQAAHRLTDAYPDGQLFVDLAGTRPHATPLTPAQALAQLLRSLGINDTHIPADPADRVSLYRSLLHTQHMLIVLDDAHSAEQIRPLIPSNTSALLTTSRRRLTALATHDGATLLTLPPLTEDESARLLTTLGSDLLLQHPHLLPLLTHACAGLPLALRSAVTHLTHLPPHARATAAHRYADPRHLLDHLTPDNDPRTNLRAAFHTAYHALPPDAAHLFDHLAHHHTRRPHAPITLDHSATLTGTTPTTAHHLLTTLTHHHLLQHDTADTYRFHPLVAHYATQHSPHHLLTREPVPRPEGVRCPAP
ncbi:BTAD domain-containing putative transcriptional regulator [Streptomyces sp. NPDC087440]|uniref:AfsR/SARP family transcriptional regulator n=1 Tax=Streptomyces sp. NPDC087440 TaxID=3365790 RepID=UPI003813D351